MRKLYKTIVIICTLLLAAALFAACAPKTDGGGTATNTKPQLTSISVARENSAYVDEENTLCLELVNNACETVIVTLNFSNASNYAITSFKLGETEFTKSQFLSGYTATKVQVKYAPPVASAGGFSVSVTSFFYSNGTTITEVTPAANNTFAVSVAPKFNVTVNMSESVLPESESIMHHSAVDFMSYMDFLYDASDMNTDDYAPSGYVFAGWYASADADTTKATAYTNVNKYEFYTDMTFYALYEPIFTYEISGGTATLTGLTAAGRKLYVFNLPETIDGNIVTELGSRVFENFGLTNLTLNASLTQIGDYAFKNCTSLKSVSWNNTLSSIGIQAFYGCTSITTMTLFPSSLKTLNSGAFAYCGWSTRNGTNTYSKVLYIPNTIEYIGNDCFRYTTFKEVWFEEGASVRNGNEDNMGSYMFSAANSLTDVYTSVSLSGSGKILSDNAISYIPTYAFAWCKNLSNVTLSEGVTKIGAYAFANTDGNMEGFTSITIPDSLLGIATYAFLEVPLTSLNFKTQYLTAAEGENSSNLEYIGDYAFQGVDLSGEVCLYTDKLKTVGICPFYNCLDVTEIFLTAGTATSVPDYSANYTSGFTSQSMNPRIKFYVPSAAVNKYKQNWYYSNDLLNTKNYLSIYSSDNIVTSGGQKYSYEYFSDAQKTLKLTNVFSSADTTLVIDTITIDTVQYTIAKIGAYVASENLEKIIIRNPQNLTEIEDYAFCGATNLKVFATDESATQCKFENFTALEIIGSYAFSGTAVNYFKAPSSLNLIKNYSFSATSGLNAVIFKDTTQPSITIYSAAFYGSGVQTVLLSSNINTIGANAFGDCSKLSEVFMEQLDIPAFTNEGGHLTCIFGNATTATIYAYQSLINKINAIDSRSDYYCYRGSGYNYVDIATAPSWYYNL